MIAAMKKLLILSVSSRNREFTAALREFGAVHITSKEGKSASLEELREERSFIQQAFQAIPAGKLKAQEAEPLEQAVKTAQEVMETVTLLKEKEAKAESLHREMVNLEKWGDFDPLLFQSLSEAGVPLSLAVVSKNEQKNFPKDLRYIVLSRKKGTLLIIGNTNDLDFEFLRLPEHSLSELQQERERLVEEHSALEQKLAGMQHEKNILQRYLELLEKKIEFTSVQASLGETEDCPQVAVLEGFLPASSLADFRAFATENGLAYIVQDPLPDDMVPTRVENPRAIRITEPIFQFMDTLPGYREHDISFWFLIFFALFFAMIIGDAGYGLLLSLVSLFLMIRAKIRTKRIPNVLILFTTLGLGTLVWGALTGNWFGYAPFGEIPFLNQFIVPRLYAFADGIAGEAVEETLLLFCFSLGMVHILLAHLLSAIKKLREAPRIHCLADFGWMLAMIGLYFFVLNLVVDAVKYPIPSAALLLILGGLIAVLLFDGQKGDGFFRGLSRTLNVGNLIHTALTAISSFADIISYIRLFAVGLATVEIAKSFNNMAGGAMQAGSVFAVVAGIVVLLIGHALNLVMGGLSVLVHGIRLKMLEFSGHLGNEWTGFAYRPFSNSHKQEE